MQIKYSIIIPTRNGLRYLKSAIQSVLNSDRQDIELVVSNNHSADGTEEFLLGLSDPRLKIVRPPELLPMAGHYEFAISQSQGEWISILGDDDAVMPYMFSLLDLYVSQFPGIDIISSARAYYFWPGCEAIYGDTVVNYSSRPAASVRSTQRDLLSTLAGLRSCFDMPQIYTSSIVKRSLYEEVRIKSGGYFYHSIIPDMYSVVALCLSRKRYLRVEEPLFWTGTSSKSMGVSDRIYLEARQFVEGNRHTYPGVPSGISEQVSFSLHSNAFSSLYIYEALLQTPLGRRGGIKLWLRRLVLASVFNDCRKREVGVRDYLYQEIIADANKYTVSIVQVYILAFVTRLLNECIFKIHQISRLISRVTWVSNTIRIESSDRAHYFEINIASAEVERLRNLNL